MIEALGPHAGFIVASYAATILVVAGLILWVVADHRAQLRRLANFEDRGIRRRSARGPATGTSLSETVK
jgi:heme exporter protein D